MLIGIVILIEILISYLLQSAVFPFFELAGSVPDVLLILIVTIAIYKGQKAGMLTGFFAGILMDFCIGEVIGLFAAIYLFIGFLCGFAVKIFDREDVLIPLGITTLAELVYCLIYYVLLVLLQGNLNFGFSFVRVILPRVVYTALISIVFYRIFLAIHLHLPERVREEERS